MSKLDDAGVIIIGAGMSGLLAAHMLRFMNPVIVEKSDGLPNNHKALFRLKTNEIEQITGIPLKKVNVKKAIWFHGEEHHQATNQMIAEYSLKNTDAITHRSIMNLDDCVRYVPPVNFIERLANGLDIEYGHEASIQNIQHKYRVPIINTAPLWVSHKEIGYVNHKAITPVVKPIWTVQAKIVTPVTSLHTTWYVPHVHDPSYRVSITGDMVTIECSKAPLKSWNLDILNKYARDYLTELFGGVIRFKVEDVYWNESKLGKIVNPEAKREECKAFISMATRHYGMFSLGRWATYRNIQLDDVVQDVKKIRYMIEQKGYF